LPEKSEEIIPTCLYNLLLWIIEGYDSDNEISIPLEKSRKHNLLMFIGKSYQLHKI